MNKTQYTLIVDQISITFFNDSLFLYPKVNWQNIDLASINDIFSSKLFILGKRATWRDYVDIAFLLKSQKVDLSQGIKDAIKRYQITQKWILEPLTYFEDITLVPIEWLNKSIADITIKNYLIKKTKKYLSGIY